MRRALASHRLMYTQVHEDPRLELECLAPAFDGPIAIVSSAGCTALSLLAAGARDVRAVDLNPVQNHLVELKLAALTHLPHDAALRFLGAWPATADARMTCWRALAPELTPPARTYWSAHLADLARGVLGAGASERFIHHVAAIARILVHPADRMRRLLACTTIADQRALYTREWNTWRWRLLFRILLGRRALSASHDPRMFRHVRDGRFATHFRARFEHTVTTLPVHDNYFLHYALTDRYARHPGALPPYLTALASCALRNAASGLATISAPFTEYLRTLADGTVAGFALSNIGEWLDANGLDALFAEIARTARPDAVLCFRNFVGWTEVPARWRHRVVEDRARGLALLRRDRSLVNRRFAVCRVRSA